MGDLVVGSAWLEAWLMITVGAVLSTVNVVLGPAAGALLPAVSDAVPAAIEMPSVPSPVIVFLAAVKTGAYSKG